jgi:hypothetical protein
MKALQITIFTTMKPFRGEFIRIQRNAIRSWLALEPIPEILVFGNDEGVAEVCAEFGLRHIPDVRTAPSGAPYLDDLFNKAQELSTRDLLCYVNADIILMPDFLCAIWSVFSQVRDPIIICTPYNVLVEEEIDFESPQWMTKLRKRVQEQLPKAVPLPIGADIFVFRRGTFSHLKPLILGRLAWDNYLIFVACRSKHPVVDISPAVIVIHQHHKGTTHVPQGDFECTDFERKFNTRLARWERFTVAADVPFILCATGTICRRPGRLPHLPLPIRLAVRVLRYFGQSLLCKTSHFRRRVGLYRWWTSQR